MKFLTTLITIAILNSPALGRAVPENIAEFYNKVKQGTCPTENVLKRGLRPGAGASAINNYCRSDDHSYIWIDGPQGKLADMDIDCDGDQRDQVDGRCRSSTTTQGQTRFVDDVKKFGISDLNANKIPYVVFGNEAGGPF